MKKEATNSFQGGLVSDLNVLTTPNNVLTDCVNGAFVTFNGDELTLQNDMGNTTIKYNGNDVQLSPGFYPLGIKEYGGVLYIVSSDGTNVEFGSYPSPEFESLVHVSGTIVNDSNILYKSAVINNDIFQSGKYINFVLDSSINSTYISYYDSSGIYHPLFYKVKLYHQLNNGFRDLTDDVWDKYKIYRTSHPEASNYWFNEPKFNYYCPDQYKGKLAVSLEIEGLSTFKLTGSPTITYVAGTPNTYTYTFSVNAVGYGLITIPSVYAYLSFNGQQILSPKTESIVDGIATFSFTGLDASYAEKVVTYNVVPNLLINGITYVTPYVEDATTTLNAEIAADSSVTSITVTDTSKFPSSGKISIEGEFFIYTSKTSTTFDGVSQDLRNAHAKGVTVSQVSGTSNYSMDFPSEYRNKFVLTGNKLVSTALDDVKFILSNGNCNLSTGKKEYNIVILENSNGQYLDNNLNIVESPYIFIKSGTSIPEGDTVISEFTVSNDYPVVSLQTQTVTTTLTANTMQGSTNISVVSSSGFSVGETIIINGDTLVISAIPDETTITIENGTTSSYNQGDIVSSASSSLSITDNLKFALENTLVNIIDASCSQAIVTIIYNTPLTNAEDSVVIQNGTKLIPMSNTSNTTYTYNIWPGIDFSVSATKKGFNAGYTTCNVSKSETLNFALIATIDAHIDHSVSQAGKVTYYWIVQWSPYEQCAGDSIPILLDDVSYSMVWVGTLYKSALIESMNDSVELVISSGTSLTGTYENIPDNSKYVTISGSVFTNVTQIESLQ